MRDCILFRPYDCRPSGVRVLPGPLVHDTCQPKLQEIGSAPDSLAAALGTSGQPVRATLASVEGHRGLALIATNGVYFAAAVWLAVGSQTM